MEKNLLGEEIIRVKSFTDDNIEYTVNKNNKTCTCPNFQKRKILCKHLKKVLGIADESTGFSKSLLKSAMQKAVRRGCVMEAVKCSKIHLKKNCNDFWRRLAIVVVEDVILHPEYRRIVDLASRSSAKSYVPNEEDEKFG